MRALAAAATPPLRALLILRSPRPPPPIPRFTMNPSSSSSSASGGYHSRPAAAASPNPRGGGGGRGRGGGGRRGGRGGGDRGDRMDALGSSSSSTGGYHSMAAAFSSMHLNDGAGTQQRRGGWRGGRGGRDGSERIDALRSSPPSPSSTSAGYHHSSAAADFAPPQPRGGWREGRGGGRGGGGGGDPSDRIAALGRLLSRVLRHMAVKLGLDMRPDGYVRVRDLLRLNVKTYAEVPFKAHTIDEIREAVRRDTKQRFSLLEEDGELWVRANQGHSVTTVASESLLKPILSADEVPVCVHGTYRKSVSSILQSGLKRMGRVHVHFSSALPSQGEVISGIRRDVNILIHLDVRKALHDGMKLYVSDNKVILTEGFDGVVPVKYFEKIETWPKRTLVPFEK